MALEQRPSEVASVRAAAPSDRDQSGTVVAPDRGRETSRRGRNRRKPTTDGRLASMTFSVLVSLWAGPDRRPCAWFCGCPCQPRTAPVPAARTGRPSGSNNSLGRACSWQPPSRSRPNETMSPTSKPRRRADARSRPFRARICLAVPLHAGGAHENGVGSARDDGGWQGSLSSPSGAAMVAGWIHHQLMEDWISGTRRGEWRCSEV